MASFRMVIVTPEKIIMDGEVDSLVAPGVDGLFGVLAGHAPMLAAVRPGTLSVRDARENRLFVIGAGVFEAKSGGCVLTIEDAIPAANAGEAEEILEKYNVNQ